MSDSHAADTSYDNGVWAIRGHEWELRFPYLHELLKTGELSDIIIKCGHREWKLHKAFLAANSRWFKTAFTGTFIESQSDEIVLHDVGSDTFDSVVRYIYGQDLCDIVWSIRESWPLYYINFHDVADYLGMEALADAIIRQFGHRMCEECVEMEDFGDDLTPPDNEVVDHLPVDPSFMRAHFREGLFAAIDIAFHPDHRPHPFQDDLLRPFTESGIPLLDEWTFAEVQQRPWLVKEIKEQLEPTESYPAAVMAKLRSL